ncbi:mitochondrial intermediate peptidase [Chaetomium fimeti]|uniref:Mitochondrial intermediate peptidase n=1 Tax=Chaetomium fimeti TaxID=1854472 RepID=A0AAE0HQY8_9PEZI|nr:mitochondrial intermediate peptidase [Chaetomium fimeti]
MIRAVTRPRQLQRWVCSSCLFQRTAPVSPARQQHRFTTSHKSNSVRDQPIVPVSHAPITREDDFVLRSVFDYPQFWKDFTNAQYGMSVGLFRNSFLREPRGFITFSRVSLKKARAVVAKVLAASSVAEYRLIVRDLDRLSDILCRVLDMADFVRVTHPNKAMQRNASTAWESVYEYMNELNTMTGLHDQLATAMANPDVTAVWSEEEKAVAEVLKLDFTKSAVSLPQKYRDRFVKLSSEISAVGSAFVQEMAPEQDTVIFPSSELRGMDPVQARGLTQGGNVYLPTLSGQAALALRTVHDADARKRIFYASRTASRQSVEMLEYLMKLRAELATLSGFESYGHLALSDRMMARSPEAVDQFLRALVDSNRPKAMQEMAELLIEKQKAYPQTNKLDPWDKDYYSDLIRRPLRLTGRQGDILSSYFSLGVVMQGLSRLFTELYGIRLIPRQPLVGETWHPDVRRLDVVSDTDGHVAVLYCDLFNRADKSPNPAHFTVRCSREIFKEEMAEVWEQSQQDPEMAMTFGSPELAANDGMTFSRHGNTIKQLPTIALVCDFPQPSNQGDQPALLSFFQLETLFHEMGHAIHSVLARTSFQTVSGTRCATDLAELPSTLMEFFAADAAVLGQFARHHETGEPLPYRMVAQKARQARRFEASDTENQILLAMLDQALHSPRAAAPGFDPTAIFHGIQKAHSCAPPDPPGTSWPGFFGHLSGYGSTYYSYLFDRVLAQRVWDVVFRGGERGGALKRENGERLKESLLKWGGARDPWRCLSEVLGDDRLAEGGEEAMALVGSWGSTKQK